MRDVYQNVTIQLFALEGEMRDLGLWSDESPQPHQLRSTAPFACDQLSLPEWLQFIFLPRMHQLVEGRLSFPGECNIAPYAQEWAASQSLEAATLLEVLRALDELITAAD